jgi:hypothetical protein
LKILREEKAASALGGGRENHSIPKTETVAGGKFGGAHDHGFGRLDQGEGVTPAKNRGTRLRRCAVRLSHKKLE